MTNLSTVQIDNAVSELSTFNDLARWACSQFNKAGLYYGHGTDNAWDEAISLLMQSLHLPFEMLEDNPESVMSSRLTIEEKQQIVEAIARRVNERIPLAYITHQAWFCGLAFYIDERVLVPRSPFAELINNGFQPWLNESPSMILDLCTGSGCIAIALAYQFEQATVDAVDISEEALAVAEINIQEHGLSDRVFPIKSDLMSALEGQVYDLIVSNPPYVDAEDMSDLPDEFHHEPELGLAAGDDGLILVDVMLKQAREQLSESGWLFVEVGNSQVHMQAKYPQLALDWIEFEFGGQGVFAVSKANLDAFYTSATD